MNTKFVRAIIIIALIGLGVFNVSIPAKAGIATGETWTDFENISKTSTSSSYPTMTADRAGNIHVLWVEDVGGKTKNPVLNPDGTPLLDFRGKPVNILTEQGNSLYYTRWNGKRWSLPTDIQAIASGTISFPSSVVDKNGILHVVWSQGVSQIRDLMYSQAPADRAEDVRLWTTPVTLASPILDYYFPTAITTDSTGGLHIIFYQYGSNPGVYIINSFDSGQNWSFPILLQFDKGDTGTQNGYLPVRMMVDGKDRLHATWSRFDSSGNGKAIYYSQSTDLGRTWSKPYEVSYWRVGFYEVDWLSVGVVGDKIYLDWEGGPQSFQNERVSVDGGKTWSEEKRILPLLVGENGWADLVTDSNNRLYQILVKRLSGNGFTLYGAWFSQLVNDQWSTPFLIGRQTYDFYDYINTLTPDDERMLLNNTINGDGLRYPRAAIVNGNELFVILVNEHDGEIYSSHVLLDAPYIAPQPFPARSSQVGNLVAATEAPIRPATEQSQELPGLDKNANQHPVSPGSIIMFSLLPVFLLIIIGLAGRHFLHKN